MDKVYSGYELEINKNVEDIAYNGRMLKIEGNSKQEIIEAVKGKSVTGEIIRATDIQNKNGRVIIEGNSRQEEIEEVKGKEVTGEFITVNDVELEDGRITVSGNSKQESRSGKNLINVNGTSGTKNGVTYTFDNDGTIALSGTNTLTSGYLNFYIGIINIPADGTYFLSGGVNSNTYVQLYNTEWTTDVKDYGSGKGVSLTKGEYHVRVVINYKQKNCDGIIIKPQLELGTSKTEYEQYGAMPSPDYPSEVKSCGGNVNVFDGVFEQGYLDAKGNKIDATTDILSTMFISVKPNTSYTFSCAEGYKIDRIWTYKNDKTLISRSDPLGVQTITTDSNTYYIRFTIYGNGNTITPNMVSKAKIEKGTQATPYSPYGQGCINEVICNKNLFDKNNNGIVKNKFINPDGTLESSNMGSVSNFINCKENKEFVISRGVYEGYTNRIVFFDENKNVLSAIENTSETYTFTTPQNTKYLRFQFPTSNVDTIQLEEGTTATEIIEHKSQAFTIPTQEPMLEGDYFNIYSKYEIHKWGKYIFTGNESFSRMSDSTDIHSRFTFSLQTAKNGSKMYCNMLPQVSQYITLDDDDEAIQLRDISNDNMISIIILNSRLSAATADGFKAYLKSLYDAGKPMYIWYELASKKGIALTDEQFEILSEMYNTEIYVPETNVYSENEVSPNTTLKYNYVLPTPSMDIPSDNKSCGDNVNIFDKDNANIINAYFYDAKTIVLESYTKSLYIPINANTTYSVSKIASTTFRTLDINELPANNVVGNTYLVNDEGTTLTITTGSNAKYLCIYYYNSNRDTINEQEILDSIKIEKSSRASGYSPYGQGCINEVICNKNLFDKNNIVEGSFMISALVSNADWCYNISQLFKAKETYTTSGGRCILSYFNGNTHISYEDITNKTVTIPEGTTKVYISTLKANLDTLQIEEGTKATEKVEHKEQVFIIPTQQPFRKVGDYKDIFIKLGNTWYERHHIARKIFDGTTNVITNRHNSIYTETNSFFQISLEGKIKGTSGSFDYSVCNYLKNLPGGASTAVKEIGFWWENSAGPSYISLPFLTKQEGNLWLRLLNEQGNPLYIDYVLATPTYIECTEEQSEILNKLHNITVYVPETNVYSENEVSPNATLKYDYVLPSPSPEIPSEIESSGDNINILSLNNATRISGVTINWQDINSVSISSIAAYGSVVYYFKNFKKNTNYVLSFDMFEKACSSNKRVTIVGNSLPQASGQKSIKDTINYYLEKNKKLSCELAFNTGDYEYVGFIFWNNSSATNLSINSLWEITNMKLEKGSKASLYSSNNEGCINEVVGNKNLINTTFESGDLHGGHGGNEVNKERIRTADYIRVKPNTKYILSPVEAVRLIEYDIDKKYIKVLSHVTNFVTSKDTRYIRYSYLQTTVPDKIQLEQGSTSTDYTPHQSQTFTIPTQQPMRAIGDYKDTFIKVDGKWFERHYIERKVFDGTENWKASSAFTNSYYTGFTNSKYISSSDISSDINVYTLSNLMQGTYRQNLSKYNYAVALSNSSNIMIKNIDISSIDNLITLLSKQYNAGTPVYVDYVLATPIDIECTPEQEIILEKMQNIKLYEGINYIYSLDDVEALLTFEYYYKMKDYDFYLSADGYLNIPSLGIRYLVDLNESSIPNMPEAVESAVRVAGRDGDVVLNTTYEPIPFNIVCYTEDNLTAMEKTEQETKINSFLNSIKNRTKRFAIEKNTKFYEVKYNGALTTINFPKFLKFSIPFKSSDSYGKDIVENIMVGNEKVNSNTIKEVGALITIKGPAISPIIALNDYSIEYSTDIIDGARIEIDTNKSTVTHINSDEVKTNVMKYYNHQFPKIENGENELKILSGIDDNNRVNIKWNDLKL